MGNRGGDEKSVRRGKLMVKICRKLKKLAFLGRRRSSEAASLSPPQAIYCDELVLPSGGKEKSRAKYIYADPFVAAHIAAQNHFTMRPNIYL